MGVKEFSTALASFNEQQLTDIQTAVDEIQLAVNDIKNTDLSQVNNKIGTDADALGPGTLFSRLKNAEAYSSRIGANTDASGTTTLFARMAQLAAYVDTLETTVGANATKIGTNADASGTTTLFARFAQIAAYVDTLEALTGGSADGVGAATLFGRIYRNYDYMVNTVNPNIVNTYNLINNYSPIRSIQRGTWGTVGGVSNITIASVNLSKAHVNIPTNGIASSIMARLTSATNLEMTGSNGGQTASWEVIEYK